MRKRRQFAPSPLSVPLHLPLLLSLFRLNEPNALRYSTDTYTTSLLPLIFLFFLESVISALLLSVRIMSVYRFKCFRNFMKAVHCASSPGYAGTFSLLFNVFANIIILSHRAMVLLGNIFFFFYVKNLIESFFFFLLCAGTGKIRIKTNYWKAHNN